MGLCYLDGSAFPVLVMERVESSLDELLETSLCLPLTLKQSMLALVYQEHVYMPPESFDQNSQYSPDWISSHLATLHSSPSHRSEELRVGRQHLCSEDIALTEGEHDKSCCLVC